MHHFRIRALVPALALVLGLAAGVRAECAGELDVESMKGKAVLITTYETSEQYYVALWSWSATPIYVKVTYTTERGVYQMPDGSRIGVLCDENVQLS